jgi:hypothetical protein
MKLIEYECNDKVANVWDDYLPAQMIDIKHDCEKMHSEGICWGFVSYYKQGWLCKGHRYRTYEGKVSAASSVVFDEIRRLRQAELDAKEVAHVARQEAIYKSLHWYDYLKLVDGSDVGPVVLKSFWDDLSTLSLVSLHSIIGEGIRVESADLATRAPGWHDVLIGLGAEVHMCLSGRNLLPPRGWYDMNFKFIEDTSDAPVDSTNNQSVLDRGLEWHFEDREDGRRTYHDVMVALPELLHVPFVKLPASKLLALYGCIAQCVDYSCLSTVARRS